MARNKPYKRSRIGSRNHEDIPEDKRRRSPGGRELTVKPQFPLDDIYVTIFTERRTADEAGNIIYAPIKPRIRPTNVEMLDALRLTLDKSDGNLRTFGERYGLTPPDVNGLVLALTGMEATTFRLAWQMRRVDELLRYTDLPITEVARRSGVGSTTNLFYACQRDFHCSPSKRRYNLREENDLGRYR